MRVLVALAVVVVFAAMMIFDTAALFRLTVSCVTGGCGISPIWLASGVAVIVLAAVLSSRRPRATAKVVKARKKGPARPARGKTATQRKPKPAK